MHGTARTRPFSYKNGRHSRFPRRDCRNNFTIPLFLRCGKKISHLRYRGEFSVALLADSPDRRFFFDYALHIWHLVASFELKILRLGVAMPKEEWGVKRLCGACGVRFYDLGRDPVDCPVCGATFAPPLATAVKTRATKATASKAVVNPDDEDDDDLDVIDKDDDDDDDEDDGIVEPKIIIPGEDDDEDDDDDDVTVVSEDDDDDDELEEDVLLADDDDDDDDDLGEFSKVDVKDKDI